jgi:Tol biopolymer transport system component
MNSDGSNKKNITNTEIAREANPDWSPDGSLIVYENYVNPDSEIFTIRPDGTDKKQITDNEVFDFEPEWSPSGDRIAFVHDHSDTGKNVHIMNSDGIGVQKLTPSMGTETSPSWSPDGSKIVYSQYTEGYYQISVYSVEYDDILNTYYTPNTDQEPHWNYK